MPTDQRRAAARRRAWGRGPAILRFEPLEGRQLLATGAGATGPDLVATRLDAPHNEDWGDTVTVEGTVANRGDATAGTAFQVDIYASPTLVPGSQVQLVGSATLPAGLTPGTSAPFKTTVKLPAWPIAGLNGAPSYYLVARVDSKGQVAESNEANNVGQGLQGVDTSLVTITPHDAPALRPTALAVAPGSLAWGGLLTVAATVRNDGPGDAPATRALVKLTPYGTAPGTGHDVTVGSLSVPSIRAEQETQVSQAIALPKVPPTLIAGGTKYVATIELDADHATTNAVNPAHLGFGIDGAAVSITSDFKPIPADQLPNLSVAAVKAPADPVNWAQPFQVATTVQNSGHADVAEARLRFLLVDDAAPTAPPLAVVDTTLKDLKAGMAQDVLQTVDFGGKLPARLTPGGAVSARVVVQVDPENTVDEANEADNQLRSGPIALQLIGLDGRATPIAANGTTVTPTGSPAPTPGTPTPAGSGQPGQGSGAKPGSGGQTGGSKSVDTESSKARRAAQILVRQQRLQAAREARQHRLANLRIHQAHANIPAPHGKARPQLRIFRPGAVRIASNQGGDNQPA